MKVKEGEEGVDCWAGHCWPVVGEKASPLAQPLTVAARTGTLGDEDTGVDGTLVADEEFGGVAAAGAAKGRGAPGIIGRVPAGLQPVPGVMTTVPLVIVN